MRFLSLITLIILYAIPLRAQSLDYRIFAIQGNDIAPQELTRLYEEGQITPQREAPSLCHLMPPSR